MSPKFTKHFLLHVILISSLMQMYRTIVSEFQMFCNILLITTEAIFHSTIACYCGFCCAYRLASEGLSYLPSSPPGFICFLPVIVLMFVCLFSI